MIFFIKLKNMIVYSKKNIGLFLIETIRYKKLDFKFRGDDMDVYVARQAIFDINKKVVAYELLFRNNNINKFFPVENINPTLNVIKNSFSIIGLNEITEGKPVFINFDEMLLKSGIIETLNKDLVAVEILETVNPVDTTVQYCKNLKSKGYTIVLDDFQYSGKFDKLIEYVDIIKVDFTITKGKERKEIMDKVKNQNIKFLAEKVEKQEDYKEALKYGYSYFQGYFFCRPVIISGSDICGYKPTYTKLIKELNNEIIDIENVENLIKSDVSLSCKLLKIINSAYYSLTTRVKSIRNAIMIIGIDELKRWIFVMELKAMNKSSIEELTKISLIRGYFGEFIVREIDFGVEKFDMFLAGLFSLVDALANQPLDKVLNTLPVSQDIKDALMCRNNMMGELLDLIVKYERGTWEEVNILVKKMGLDREFLTNCYLKAIGSVKGLDVA